MLFLNKQVKLCQISSKHCFACQAEFTECKPSTPSIDYVLSTCATRMALNRCLIQNDNKCKAKLILLPKTLLWLTCALNISVWHLNLLCQKKNRPWTTHDIAICTKQYICYLLCIMAIKPRKVGRNGCCYEGCHWLAVDLREHLQKFGTLLYQVLFGTVTFLKINFL